NTLRLGRTRSGRRSIARQAGGARPGVSGRRGADRRGRGGPTLALSLAPYLGNARAPEVVLCLGLSLLLRGRGPGGASGPTIGEPLPRNDPARRRRSSRRQSERRRGVAAFL